MRLYCVRLAQWSAVSEAVCVCVGFTWAFHAWVWTTVSTQLPHSSWPPNICELTPPCERSSCIKATWNSSQELLLLTSAWNSIQVYSCTAQTAVVLLSQRQPSVSHTESCVKGKHQDFSAQAPHAEKNRKPVDSKHLKTWTSCPLASIRRVFLKTGFSGKLFWTHTINCGTKKY